MAHVLFPDTALLTPETTPTHVRNLFCLSGFTIIENRIRVREISVTLAIGSECAGFMGFSFDFRHTGTLKTDGPDERRIKGCQRIDKTIMSTWGNDTHHFTQGPKLHPDSKGRLSSGRVPWNKVIQVLASRHSRYNFTGSKTPDDPPTSGSALGEPKPYPGGCSSRRNTFA
ncbi:hypothetical protein BS47DRAFT_1400565 [Hydnum rufescens UP504]|uniref:Uncharacterized protein n=1 Tax=Hydnum rufescens UP504 TaxID=1448309 RepID=A0A9P6DIE8_9AGAM|nr:hypothetical protein BS47DRAFT_1400565 [Hydnum rufescens UP504]